MNVITDRDALHETVQHYLGCDAFCFDVETIGSRRLDPCTNRVAWISLATAGRADVIPLGHPNGNVLLSVERPLLASGLARLEKDKPLRESDYSKDKSKHRPVYDDPPAQLSPGEAFAELRPLMASDVLKVGHNVKFDAKSIAKYLGFFPARPFADTMIAAFVHDNRNGRSLSLKDCLKRELDFEMQKGIGAMIERHSFVDVARYSYLDAKYTWLLWTALRARLDGTRLWNVFRLEMDVLDVVCRMELRGVDIDEPMLERLRDDLAGELQSIKEGIYRDAGRAFNLNSNPAKQELLFTPKKSGGRGLRSKDLTPKGIERQAAKIPLTTADYSVSAQALEKFRGKDAVVDGLLKYAEVSKLVSTYVTPYLGGEVERTVAGRTVVVTREPLVVDGRIHTEFVQHGAETGRFSSRNPNLQNIPAPHTAHGKAIRNLFIAPPGHVLVVADYSQIEPRVIASLSQDPVMLANYADGSDIYTTVGDTMNVDRRTGKTLVLSVSYDVGPRRIAQSLGCSEDDARDLIDRFYDNFPDVRRYKKEVVKNAAARRPVPYVTTKMGRRRFLPDLRSSEYGLRARAERQAFNTKIQGTAADIIKVAMVRADTLLPEEAELVLTVHDELVACAPAELADESAQAITEAMEQVGWLDVPLVADLKVVTRWGDAK